MTTTTTAAVAVSVSGTARVDQPDAFERAIATNPVTTFTGQAMFAAITKSEPYSGSWNDVGGMRLLTFADGTTTRETLTAHEFDTRYAYRGDQFTNVLRSLVSEFRSEWRFREDSTGATVIDWTMEFEPLPLRRSILRFFFAPAWKKYMESVLARTIVRIEAGE